MVKPFSQISPYKNLYVLTGFMPSHPLDSSTIFNASFHDAVCHLKNKLIANHQEFIN
jgi:hypothetical protein